MFAAPRWQASALHAADVQPIVSAISVEVTALDGRHSGRAVRLAAGL